MSEIPKDLPWSVTNPGNQHRNFEAGQSANHESPLHPRESGISYEQIPEEKTLPRKANPNGRKFPGSYGEVALSETADHSHMLPEHGSDEHSIHAA